MLVSGELPVGQTYPVLPVKLLRVSTNLGFLSTTPAATPNLLSQVALLVPALALESARATGINNIAVGRGSSLQLGDQVVVIMNLDTLDKSAIREDD